MTRQMQFGGVDNKGEYIMWETRLSQQGDLRLKGPPSGRGADGGARARDRRVPADLRADSLTTEPPTPPAVPGLCAYIAYRKVISGYNDHLRQGRLWRARTRTRDRRIPPMLLTPFFRQDVPLLLIHERSGSTSQTNSVRHATDMRTCSLAWERGPDIEKRRWRERRSGREAKRELKKDRGRERYEKRLIFLFVTPFLLWCCDLQLLALVSIQSPVVGLQRLAPGQRPLRTSHDDLSTCASR
ncbi:hypothetical protein PoB_004492500 [Plakobranchus ocellatus]|uniref:Uncharacterized protein n=1 Tax=Plakobranchus ocellatus TaxID=259542 RepID=A0AAV4BH43_9GAST|nr:hypothetical protein PoB_004492500 [Plakobranchus ocellatus]